MKGKTQIDPVGTLRCLPSMLNVSLFCSIFLLFWGVPAKAQSAHPPYGATSLTFQTATDSQGIVRHCYVTNTGLEAPTLRVNPGDQLIIHFTNNLPANLPSSTRDNMAGINMTLSSKDAPTTSTSSARNGAMSTSATHIHFHGTNVAPVCGQEEVVHTLIQPGQSNRRSRSSLRLPARSAVS